MKMPQVTKRRVVTQEWTEDAPCDSCSHFRVGVLGTPYCNYNYNSVPLEVLERCPRPENQDWSEEHVRED